MNRKILSVGLIAAGLLIAGYLYFVSNVSNTFDTTQRVHQLYNRLAEGDITSADCTKAAQLQQQETTDGNTQSENLFLKLGSSFRSDKSFDFIYSYKLHRCIGMLHSEDYARAANSGVENEKLVDIDEKIFDVITGETIAHCVQDFVSNETTCDDLIGRQTTYKTSSVPAMFPIYSKSWNVLKSLLSN